MTQSSSAFSRCEWRLGFGAGSVSQLLYVCVCRRAASTCSTWGRASMKSSKRRKGDIASWLKSIADLHSHYYTLSTRYSCFPLEFISSAHSVIQILFPAPSKAHQPTDCTTLSPCVDRRAYLSSREQMDGKRESARAELPDLERPLHQIKKLRWHWNDGNIFPHFSANCRAQTFPQSHNGTDG